MTFKYKSEVKGKGGISARVVAKSVSAYSGQEIVTWEYDAPKCILAELNTHSILVKNAQSSRAVPIKKVIEQIRTNPVTPVHWGSNKPGMVAGEEIDIQLTFLEPDFEFASYTNIGFTRDEGWVYTANQVAELMEAWEGAGYHKQIVNRIGEAFTFVRGVITGTEIDNFFHLRYHKDADPYMYELAKCMWEAYEQAEAEVLYEGEWHTPYVEHSRLRDKSPLSYGSHEYNEHDNVAYWIPITLEQALKNSSAACGQVSYRKLDTSKETVERVWNNLMGGETIHASVTCHQASPMKEPYDYYSNTSNLHWQDGITHVDRDGNFWSAQFQHWIMHRKTIENESCQKFHLRK